MIDFIYFGGEPLGVPVLQTLLARGQRPRAVVTSLDARSGRGRTLSAPPLKRYAIEAQIPVFQPATLTNPEFLAAVGDTALFVVVAYNKILPKDVIALPRHQTINLHPSLLPRYRGPSPIRSALLNNDRAGVGVSVMLLDEKMDHGPLLAQKSYPISTSDWPLDGQQLDAELAAFGGELLADTIPSWVRGDITPVPQDHAHATYTTKLTKDMGALSLDPFTPLQGPAAHAALLRIKGLSGWPGTFFFYQGKRFKINDAHLENDTLIIDTITPEGKKPGQFSHYFT